MPDYQLLSPWPREALRFTASVERTGRVFHAARRGLAAGLGQGIPAWRALTVIAQARAEPSIANVARRLQTTRQCAHSLLRALQRQGLLTMQPSPTDSRAQLVALTPTGVKLHAELTTTMRALLLEITNDIPPERLEATSAMLDRITRRLRECRSILATRLAPGGGRLRKVVRRPDNIS